MWLTPAYVSILFMLLCIHHERRPSRRRGDSQRLDGDEYRRGMLSPTHWNRCICDLWWPSRDIHVRLGTHDHLVHHNLSVPGSRLVCPSFMSLYV